MHSTLAGKDFFSVAVPPTSRRSAVHTIMDALADDLEHARRSMTRACTLCASKFATPAMRHALALAVMRLRFLGWMSSEFFGMGCKADAKTVSAGRQCR